MRLLPVAVVFVVLFGAFVPKEKALKLAGHWTTDKDLFGIAPGDTLVLHKVKYHEGLYTWGGPAGGYEFDSDHRFTEYFNVLCSDESSPVRYTGEAWKAVDDHTLLVEGESRCMKFYVLSCKAHELKLIVQP